MKTKLLFLTTIAFVFFNISLKAQTSVPDANFEHYLETHDANGNVVAIGTTTNSMGDGTDGNGLVTTANISGVTNLNLHNFSGNLNPTNNPITTLTGIEDFTALKVLWCYFNQITTLDTSQNVNLEELKCSDNQLTSLNVSQNTNLVKLYCKGNQLAVLDVSNNVNLEELISGGNPFTSGLNIYNNTLLQLLNCTNCQLTALDVSQNTNLTSLNVHTNQLKALDVSQNTNLTSLNIHTNQLTSLIVKNGANNLIPAADFWATNNSNLTCIEVSDIAYATSNWTNIDPQHIFNTTCVNSLTYVPDAAFETYLETHAADGSVVAVGASNSMGDGIAGNQLVTTSKINTVTTLLVEGLGISDLTGIEDFIALTTLHCNNNNLTTLNVSLNIALTDLRCHQNNLTTLDVSQNTALTSLHCYVNNLTTLDVSQNTVLTELYCLVNNLTTLDVSQNTALTTLNCRQNNLTTLDVSQNTALTTLNCSSNQLTVLDVSLNIALTDLRCHQNNLTTLNVRQNTALIVLTCYTNNLTTLDTSQNTALTKLYCKENNLTTLDISQNTVLTELSCSSNNLTSLKANNGNNTNFVSFAFDIRNNQNLTCIEVDNVAYSTTNWPLIDVGASYSTDCSTVWTVMTNPTTTTALLTITGLDADNDGNITLAEAAAFIGPLDLSSSGITDVEGLQAFTSITTLDVSGNGITDLSPLTSSTFSIVAKSSEKTQTIAKTQTMALEEIVLSNNNFDVVDLSSLTNLKVVKLNDNPNLITVSIQNGNNGAITEFNSSNTPNLTCILVDDVNAGYLSSWTKDVKSTYVAGEADCRARVLSINDFDISNQISLYPNPVNDILTIKVPNSIELQKIEVYNVLGEKLKASSEKTIKLTNFPFGIYLLKITTSKGAFTRKIIKEKN